MLEGNARRLIGLNSPFPMPLHRPDEQQEHPNDEDDRERGSDSASHVPMDASNGCAG